MEFTLKDIVKAYTAGIIDGEGCIFAQKQFDNREGRNKTYFRVSVIIAMINPEPLQFIQSHYGGKLGTKSPTPSRKTVFRLTIISDEALLMLEEIEPFLLIKHKSAKAAIALQRHIMCNHSRICNGDGSALLEREVLFQTYRAAAETERAGIPIKELCDSPHLIDDKIEG
jgi:hypothetical protein